MDAETRRHGDTESGESALLAHQSSAVDRPAAFSASPHHRVSASAFRWLVRISRFGLAALFLFAAAAKLAILKKFAGNVAELLSSASVNYQRWQWPVTIGVIAAEIIAAVCLMAPRTVRL